ncbi:vacuolar protein sorting-associated protein 33a [Anaeramoeba flamelloides]|uniref:Vacuolar protein sorting-associated protein 33a n=1 Tax=Anaeramoeba flamelloides TaxID=1746091 RepID=A0AAV7Y6U8_9EUKA|nr:vacuolar protein sorting-associated protein 33a [Anaeramoeba flamelloides]
MNILDLENSTVLDNIGIIREDYQEQLSKYFRKIRGDKALLIDPDLFGSLLMIVSNEFFRKNNIIVQQSLSSKPINYEEGPILILVRTEIQKMNLVSSFIKEQEKKNGKNKHKYHLFFVPHQEILCEKALETSGVRQLVTLYEFDLDLFPLDQDLLTMSRNSSFASLSQGDPEILSDVAKSLKKLEYLFGQFEEICWLGKNSKLVLQIYENLQSKRNTHTSENSQIKKVILVDRTIDLITPLLTQQTYEGMVDEIYGIENSILEIDPRIVGKQTQNQENQKIRFALNSNDSFFQGIRDLNWVSAIKTFKLKSKSISQLYASSNDDRTIKELKQFIHDVQTSRDETISLKNHISISEHAQKSIDKGTIMREIIQNELSMLVESVVFFDFIKYIIYDEENMIKVLRFMCLHSLIHPGKAKQLSEIKKEFLFEYGFKYLPMLQHLEKIGLLTDNPNVNFSGLRNLLKLYNEDQALTIGPHTVFSGYKPISISLVQQILDKKKNLKNFNKATKNYLKTEYGEYNVNKNNEETEKSEEEEKGNEEEKKEEIDTNKVCLVYFIGGVTYGEISALRMLSQQSTFEYNFVIATTNIINGDQMIKSCLNL